MSFFENIARQNGALPPGAYQLEIAPAPVTLFKRTTKDGGAIEGFTAQFRVVSGDVAGMTGAIEFLTKHPHPTTAVLSVTPLQQWAQLVSADLSKVGNDPARLMAAIAHASKGKKVIATIAHDTWAKGVIIRLAGVRLAAVSEGADDANNPFA